MFRVVTVCTANICRSPFAERALMKLLDANRFEVSSAGVLGFDNEPMDPAMAKQAARFGIEVAGFRSKPVSSELIESADLVLTATREHRSALAEVSPTIIRRTFTLFEFADLVEKMADVRLPDLVPNAAMKRHLSKLRDREYDVADPVGGDYEMYAVAAEQIHKAAKTIADRLNSLAD